MDIPRVDNIKTQQPPQVQQDPKLIYGISVIEDKLSIRTNDI